MHASNAVGFINIYEGKAMNKAAAERCDAMAGAPKVKYGMKSRPSAL